MPYDLLPDGLYLLHQKSQAKRVDHYGILDVGNRAGLPQAVGAVQPVVFHQRPPGVHAEWLQDTGQWTIRQKIDDEAGALERIRIALRRPEYDLFGNNCEHFALFIATGKRESRQVQAVVVLAGLAALFAAN